MTTIGKHLRRPLAVLLAAAAIATAAAFPRAEAATRRPWLVGYYPVYNRALMPADAIPWSLMTHMAIGAALPRTDGTLDKSFYLGPGEGEPFVRDLVRRARKRGVVPILMLGGAQTRAAFFSAMDPSRRVNFVNNIVSMMQSWGFGGVNVDWEEQPDGDYPRLTELVSMIRERAPRTRITVSAFWTSSASPYVNPAWRTISAKADRIDLMTYGMSGDWPGWKSWHSSALGGAKPETPSSVASSVGAYVAAGVSRKKLNVGIGFYGTCWRGVTGPNQNISGTPTVIADDNVMSYANIMKDYYTSGAYRYDPAAQVPYLSFTAQTGPQGCTYISYEDVASVRKKSRWAVRKSLGGAIVWEITEGRRATGTAKQRNELLRAAHDGLGL